MKRQLTYLIQFIQKSKSQLLACLAIIRRFCYRNLWKCCSTTGKKIVLNKGVYTDKELDSLIGMELKSQMLDSHDDVLRINKLKKITKVVISLNELNNSDNLEDGRPSNTLFTYYVKSPEDFTSFEPHNPHYIKLKYGEVVSLTLKITDQNNNIINIGSGTTVVLHIR